MEKKSQTTLSSVHPSELWMWDTRLALFFGVLYLLGRPEVGGRELFAPKISSVE